MNQLRRLAAGGPVPVFAAIGRDAIERVEDLCLHPDIDRVESPRHASVLLVAGAIRAEDHEALRRVHDMLRPPRATLWWSSESPQGIVVPAQMLPLSEDPRSALRTLHRQLLRKEREPELDLLPDESPAPWRGVGEHGQGGKGMMGGKPYGRPMAMTADDLRDGLALDEFEFEAGPFAPMLLPGLVLGLTLQGDVIQSAQCIRPPLPASAASEGHEATPSHASGAAASNARACASSCLRHVARLLVILDLEVLAERCRRAARDIVAGESIRIDSLRQALLWAGAFAAIPPGLGRVDTALARELDSGEPSYRRSGSPAGPCDVRARLHRWLDDAEAGLRIATLGGQPDEAGPVHDAAIGSAADAAKHAVDFRFADLLAGLEWNEAMLVVNSFDATALCRMSPHPCEATAPKAVAEHTH